MTTPTPAFYDSASGKPDHARLQLLLQAFRDAIHDELSGRKPQSGQETFALPLKNGKRQHKSGRTNYFLFQSEPIPAQILDEGNPSLVLNANRFPCRVVGFSLDGLALAIDAELTPEIPEAQLAFDSLRLLQSLDKRLIQIGRQTERFGTSLALKTFDPSARPGLLAYTPITPTGSLNTEQLHAFTKSIQQDVTYVIGPPGTGKSEAISAISLALNDLGERTLICSPTNTAIDHVVDTTLERRPRLTEGSLVRLGSPSPDSSDRSQMVNLEALTIAYNVPLETEAGQIRNQVNDLAQDLKTIESCLTILTEYDRAQTTIRALQHELMESEKASRVLHHTLEERQLTLNDINHEIQEMDALPQELRILKRPTRHQLLDQFHRLSVSQQLDQERLTEVQKTLDTKSPWTANHIATLERLGRPVAWDANIWTTTELTTIQTQFTKVKTELEKKLQTIEQRLSRTEELLIHNAPIVATTLTRSYTSRLLENQRFDTVIIEEASMGIAPAIFAAACLASKRVIVVGDFLQLPPIATVRTEATKQWLARSIYRLAQVSSGNDPRVVALSTQYRMHPHIARVASRLYARAGLRYESAPNLESMRESLTAHAPVPGEALIFIDTTQAQPVTLRDPKGSLFNVYQALLAVRLAKQALNVPDQLPGVSIITPYRAQVDLIERIVRHEGLQDQVRVGTVHRFQGRASDILIFDTVNTENITRSMLGSQFADACPHLLINVAITRAKGKLIVIGHGEALAQLQHSPEPILWECISIAKEDGIAVPACSVLPALNMHIGASILQSDASLTAVLTQINHQRDRLHAV